ncbi:MAG: PEP-CTERM sorting domain-containing protein [Planctomycetota bacterium]
MKQFAFCLSAVSVLSVVGTVNADRIIFDGYGSSVGQLIAGGGGSRFGYGTPIAVDRDIEISGISALTHLFDPTPFNFVVLPFPQPQVLDLSTALYYSDARVFPSDPREQRFIGSWKRSDDFSLTLEAGEQYLIGYFADGFTLIFGNDIAESGNGITSVSNSYCLSCPEVTSDFGRDIAIRLHALPEPSSLLALVAGLGAFYVRQRSPVG